MLLERGELLASLSEHLRDAQHGVGSMVLLAGEAGAGKTSLVRSFVTSLGVSTLAVEGACDPLTTPRPLSPLHDFAADPDFGLARLTAGARPSMDIFGEVLDLLRHHIRPVVLVIEDIHWADDGTLDFLRFIGRRIADSRAMVVCTYRDDEVGADHPLRQVLGQLIPLDTTHRLLVPSLTIDAVTRLATDHPVNPADILRLTDGNAFFVTEILASGDELPRTVQDAVLARVSRLDPGPRDAVEAVSVAPRSLKMTHVPVMAGGQLDDIDDALSAGVLLTDGHDLRFRHELARSAVERSLPPARRLGLHEKMLRILEDDGSSDLARLAHHAIRADEADRVIAYAPSAARDASARGAHKEAARFFDALLRHSDRLDDEVEAAVRVELGNELGIVDRPREAQEQIDRAGEYYRKVGDRVSLAGTLIPDTGARWRFEDARRFRRDIAEAFEILEGTAPSRDLARAYVTSAFEHMLERNGRDALSDIRRARAVASEVGATDLSWIIAMIEGTILLVVGDPDEGIAILRRAAQDAATAGRGDDETMSLMMLGSGGGEVRRYGDAVPALEAGVEHGLAVDQDYLVAYCRSWLARVAHEQGRWDDAVEFASLVGSATSNQSGIATLTGLTVLGRVRVRRGDPEAMQLLDRMVALAESHQLQHGWNAVCGRTEHLWLAGRPQEALGDLEPAYHRALDTDSEWARGELGFWMWRIGAIDRPPAGVAEPFALQMNGKWRAAADVWRDIGCPYEVAMALSDGPEDAKLEALAIADELGARPLGDRVRSELRRLGVDRIPKGPSRRTRANPAGLTRRQLEVLGLITDGFSNAEIAETLYVSKKTVEHHISAIFSKLGVTSRRQARQAASNLGITRK